MPVTAIIGTQWGDEGKGKITDALADQADVVARYQGGDNAGHTVVHGDWLLRLHQIPSGILHQGTLCVLGGGMVINPRTLLQEMDELRERDAFRARMLISGRAHLIMPYHIALDGASEKRRGAGALGTTQRGIGPAYQDKAARTGLRMYDLLLPDPQLADKVRSAVVEKNLLLERVYEQQPLDPDAVARDLVGYAQRLREYIGDDSLALARALEEGQQVLFEGAQGILLDLDHGTYPYVTSSSTVLGGALAALGVAPREVTRVVGAVKAYQTRVGEGPFPTEQGGEIGSRLRGTGRNYWDEFGTTTGRPRRCGWLDLVTVRHSARVSGITELAVTKLDVLSGLGELQVCVGYRLDGQVIHRAVPHVQDLIRVEPIYERLAGWVEPLGQVRRFEDLPPAARAYVRFIEEQVGLPVGVITVGPGRDQSVTR
ncbi:MAG: adenylosuccinate synthase [Anaerolineae bacterium]|nr:adenylosuccinate synthase [Anaerolineae bacterium]